jgi:hypothetical protein
MNVTERFAFIKNSILKNEIDQNFMFIISLIDFFESSKEENQRFWYKKTIIILTASIVEAILLYTIQELEIKHRKCFWVKKTRERLIYKISTDEWIYSYREKKVTYDPNEMTFNDCIMILGDEESTHFTQEVCDKIHALRNLRNGVHIHSSLSTNPDFIKLDFEIFFLDTKVAIDACESAL